MSRWSHLRKRRVDGPHVAIVARFRERGASVWDSSSVGRGFPDIVVAWEGRTRLGENKGGPRAGKKRGKVQAATDERQAAFRRAWKDDVLILESVEDVDRALANWHDARPLDGEGFS